MDVGIRLLLLLGTPRSIVTLAEGLCNYSLLFPLAQQIYGLALDRGYDGPALMLPGYHFPEPEPEPEPEPVAPNGSLMLAASSFLRPSDVLFGG